MMLGCTRLHCLRCAYGWRRPRGPARGGARRGRRGRGPAAARARGRRAQLRVGSLSPLGARVGEKYKPVANSNRAFEPRGPNIPPVALNKHHQHTCACTVLARRVRGVRLRSLLAVASRAALCVCRVRRPSATTTHAREHPPPRIRTRSSALPHRLGAPPPSAPSAPSRQRDAASLLRPSQNPSPSSCTHWTVQQPPPLGASPSACC